MVSSILTLAVFTVVLVNLNTIDGATFSDCGSKIGAFSNVTVTDCKDSDQRCILRRNSNVSISITFTLKKDTDAIKVVVHGTVMGVEVPFNLPNSNACVNSGLVCPLGAEGTYTYIADLPVLKVYPRLDVEVKWELQNSQGEDLICVIIPAKIK